MKNKLRFWRQERELSQIELGLSSGVPRHEIQLIELGVRPASPEIQEKLATTLGLEVGEVFATAVKSSGDHSHLSRQ